jgi:MFS family permease
MNSAFTSNRRSLSPFWLLAILSGLNLFNYLDRYVACQVVEPIRLSFGLDDHQAGRLNTAFMFGYFVTAPVFGYLGDRMTRKWLIAAGIFVWSLGTVLSGVATGFGSLLGYRVLVGLGEASYATISPSLITDAYGPARRNNALTLFYVAIPVGGALGYLVGSQISEAWGWRWAFIVAGLPGLLLAVCLLPFRDPERGQAEHRQSEAAAKPKANDLLKLLLSPDYSLVVWGYVAATFAMGGFGFWGPSYLIRIAKMTQVQAGTYFATVVAVSGLLGTFGGGFAATAWRKRNPAAYALVLGISALLAAPCATWAFLGGTTTALKCGLAAAIFLCFLGTGPVNTLILETVPVNLRSGAMAMSIFLIHLFGDFWSPEILGYISVRSGSLKLAVLVLPAALLVGGALWLGLGLKTLYRHRRQAPGGADPFQVIKQQPAPP